MKMGMADECGMPLGRRRAHAKQGGVRFRSLCFQTVIQHTCCGHLPPALVVGGQQDRLPSPRRRRMDGQVDFFEPSTETVPAAQS